jgi:hypothetical protein
MSSRENKLIDNPENPNTFDPENPLPHQKRFCCRAAMRLK